MKSRSVFRNTVQHSSKCDELVRNRNPLFISQWVHAKLLVLQLYGDSLCMRQGALSILKCRENIKLTSSIQIRLYAFQSMCAYLLFISWKQLLTLHPAPENASWCERGCPPLISRSFQQSCQQFPCLSHGEENIWAMYF